MVALPGVDLEAVQREVEKQCDALPRNETARKALAHSYVVKVGRGGKFRGGLVRSAGLGVQG